jgi:hypothetical protein
MKLAQDECSREELNRVAVALVALPDNPDKEIP